MKKRILLILLILFLTSGCVNINKVSKDELIDTIIADKHNLYNHINKGYKYYLPRGLKSEKVDEFNDIIKGVDTDYYLYVDLVSYENKIDILYEENNEHYYSRIFEYGKNKKGIIDINQNEDKYIVKTIYNYATIEVKCSEEDINDVITNSLIIILSIDYNDDIINKLLDSNSFDGSEEPVNIFDKDVEESDRLEVDDTYTGNEEEDYDPNVIYKRGES